jgi:acetyl esterase/lipase
MNAPKTYTYKTVGDCAIQADVTAPSQGTGPFPVLVQIHGGALISGSRTQFNDPEQALFLEAGFVLVAIDYRLAPETKLAQIIEDIQDAFRWIRAEGPALFQADPERIAVWGQSAGGYLTLMTGICVEPKPKALVSFYGYGDLIGDWYSKPDPFYCQQPMVSLEESGKRVSTPVISERTFNGGPKEKFYIYCRQQGTWPLEVSGHDPKDDTGFFTPYCPVQNVSKAYPPTFLAHGDKDTDVPYEQSKMMAKELTRHGVPRRFITIPGGGHCFDGAWDQPIVQETFAEMVKFLRKHVLGG